MQREGNVSSINDVLIFSIIFQNIEMVRGKTSDFARHHSMNAHLISLKLKYVVNENNFVCVGKY
jgi:hypothetical protein